MSEPIVLELKESIIDPSNISIEVVGEKFLIDLMKRILENEIERNKLSIKLTPDIINTINNIIAVSPNTINDIEKSLNIVIKDGKIDSKDVPELIILIQRLYQLIYSFKNTKFDSKKRVEITSTVLKVIIHLLVLERKIEVEKEKQTQFLNETDILIDSCVGLISFSKIVKTKGCLKKLFG